MNMWTYVFKLTWKSITTQVELLNVTIMHIYNAISCKKHSELLGSSV